MIIFCDGFDSYATTDDLTKKWVSADDSWQWMANQGRKGRGAIIGGTGDGDLLTSPGGWNASTIVLGFYLRVMSKPTVTQELCILQPATEVTPQSSTLRIEVENQVGSVRLVSPDALILVAGSVNVCDDQFHWIELRTGVGTGVEHTLHIDGVPQATFTADVTYGNIDHIQFVTMSGVLAVVDDLIVYNDTAPNPVIASFPLGPREITTLRPIGDSAVQFARSSGSNNFSLVDDVAADEDATYVEDGTSGHQDLYHYADLSIAPGAITAVVINSRVKNGGPVGAVAFSSIVNSGGAQENGPSIDCPASYQNFQQSFSVDPNTSAAWTVTGLNASTFGIKVT